MAQGKVPPPKPWERVGGPSGPAPFRPPSVGSTSAVVETSGTANHGQIVPPANANPIAPVCRPVPPRPWQPNYGVGLYNNNMFRGGFGGMYGNNTYGNNTYGQQNPNNPSPSPSGFLGAMQAVLNVVGQFSLLMNQNWQAFNMILHGLGEFSEKTNMLYQLVAFVLKLLGSRFKKVNAPTPNGIPEQQGGQIAGQKAVAPVQNGQGGGQVKGPTPAHFENVWGQ